MRGRHRPCTASPVYGGGSRRGTAPPAPRRHEPATATLHEGTTVCSRESSNRRWRNRDKPCFFFFFFFAAAAAAAVAAAAAASAVTAAAASLFLAEVTNKAQARGVVLLVRALRTHIAVITRNHAPPPAYDDRATYDPCPTRYHRARAWGQAMRRRPGWAKAVVGVAAAVVTATACLHDVAEGDQAFDPRAPAVLDDGLILGPVDWRDAASLAAGSTERRAADAAGYVFIPASSSRCSGFLIAPDVVMTNHHCVPDAAHAAGVVVNFLFETQWRREGVVRCERFIGADASLDYALVGCEGRPGDRFGTLELDDAVLTVGTTVTMLHQQCDWTTTPDCEPTKKLSPGTITAVGTDDVAHDADSLGGSSGGAIVRAGTTHVVAINKAHSVPDPTTGYRGANWGTPMSAIAPHLRAHFPDVLPACGALPPTDAVLDEDHPCVTLDGGAGVVAVEGSGYGGDLVRFATLVDASAAAAPGAEWRVRPVQPGQYRLSVFVDGAIPTTRHARYRVTRGTQTDVVEVDQAAVADAGFVVLGQFALDASHGARVRVDAVTGEAGAALVVDALRVEPIAVEPPPPPPCPRVRVTASSTLNVRPQPSTSQGALGTLRADEVVTRLESASGEVVQGNAQWHRIEKPGLTGWVSGAWTVCAP